MGHTARFAGCYLPIRPNFRPSLSDHTLRVAQNMGTDVRSWLERLERVVGDRDASWANRELFWARVFVPATPVQAAFCGAEPGDYMAGKFDADCALMTAQTSLVISIISLVISFVTLAWNVWKDRTRLDITVSWEWSTATNRRAAPPASCNHSQYWWTIIYIDEIPIVEHLLADHQRWGWQQVVYTSNRPVASPAALRISAASPVATRRTYPPNRPTTRPRNHTGCEPSPPRQDGSR